MSENPVRMTVGWAVEHRWPYRHAGPIGADPATRGPLLSPGDEFYGWGDDREPCDAVPPQSVTDCPHTDFEAYVEVDRFVPPRDGNLDDPDETAPPTGWSLEVSAKCHACGVPMVFFGTGLPVGLLRDRPSIGLDGLTLACPVRPLTSDPHTGLGMAGFRTRISEGDPSTLN